MIGPFSAVMLHLESIVCIAGLWSEFAKCSGMSHETAFVLLPSDQSIQAWTREHSMLTVYKCFALDFLPVCHASYFTFVLQYWNWAPLLGSGGVITGSVNGGSWQNLQPNGGNTAAFGMMVISSQNLFRPTSITVNGNACTIM